MHEKLYEHQENLYNEKTDPWSSHSIIYDWLASFESRIRVLDIGTATGYLGKKFKNFGFYLKGIEPNRVWASEAKPFYDEFLCMRLEEAPDKFLERNDVVVFADVLEHLSFPDKTLQRVVDLQKPETQIIISVPNVAYIWVRVNLLIGRFNYSDKGILDRTHLHFYTKSTFLEMVKSSGLCIIEMKFTPAPLGKVCPFFKKHPVGRFTQRLLAFMANFFPGLFAYQFLVLSENKVGGDG